MFVFMFVFETPEIFHKKLTLYTTYTMYNTHTLIYYTLILYYIIYMHYPQQQCNIKRTLPPYKNDLYEDKLCSIYFYSAPFDFIFHFYIFVMPFIINIITYIPAYNMYDVYNKYVSSGVITSKKTAEEWKVHSVRKFINM